MSRQIDIIEFKARCADPARARQIILGSDARFHGRDHQVDIYFRVPRGRLKLREGGIETNLIFYERPNDLGMKQSGVRIFKPYGKPDKLREALGAALGVQTVVDKQRDIYYDGNIKIHIDEVMGLGSFVEVEAIDRLGKIGIPRLQAQCYAYRVLLGVRDEDMVAESYCDLIEATQSS